VKSEKLQNLIKYAYWQAILLEGWEVENIGEFVEVVNRFALDSLK
jgi:HSP90 family molecular chaperone